MADNSDKRPWHYLPALDDPTPERRGPIRLDDYRSPAHRPLPPPSFRSEMMRRIMGALSFGKANAAPREKPLFDDPHPGVARTLGIHDESRPPVAAFAAYAQPDAGPEPRTSGAVERDPQKIIAGVNTDLNNALQGEELKSVIAFLMDVPEEAHATAIVDEAQAYVESYFDGLEGKEFDAAKKAAEARLIAGFTQDCTRHIATDLALRFMQQSGPELLAEVKQRFAALQGQEWGAAVTEYLREIAAQQIAEGEYSNLAREAFVRAVSEQLERLGQEELDAAQALDSEAQGNREPPETPEVKTRTPPVRAAALPLRAQQYKHLKGSERAWRGRFKIGGVNGLRNRFRPSEDQVASLFDQLARTGGWVVGGPRSYPEGLALGMARAGIELRQIEKIVKRLEATEKGVQITEQLLHAVQWMKNRQDQYDNYIRATESLKKARKAFKREKPPEINPDTLLAQIMWVAELRTGEKNLPRNLALGAAVLGVSLEELEKFYARWQPDDLEEQKAIFKDAAAFDAEAQAHRAKVIAEYKIEKKERNYFYKFYAPERLLVRIADRWKADGEISRAYFSKENKARWREESREYRAALFASIRARFAGKVAPGMVADDATIDPAILEAQYLKAIEALRWFEELRKGKHPEENFAAFIDALAQAGGWVERGPRPKEVALAHGARHLGLNLGEILNSDDRRSFLPELVAAQRVLTGMARLSESYEAAGERLQDARDLLLVPEAAYRPNISLLLGELREIGRRGLSPTGYSYNLEGEGPLPEAGPSLAFGIVAMGTSVAEVRTFLQQWPLFIHDSGWPEALAEAEKHIEKAQIRAHVLSVQEGRVDQEEEYFARRGVLRPAVPFENFIYKEHADRPLVTIGAMRMIMNAHPNQNTRKAAEQMLDFMGQHYGPFIYPQEMAQLTPRMQTQLDHLVKSHYIPFTLEVADQDDKVVMSGHSLLNTLVIEAAMASMRFNTSPRAKAQPQPEPELIFDEPLLQETRILEPMSPFAQGLGWPVTYTTSSEEDKAKARQERADRRKAARAERGPGVPIKDVTRPLRPLAKEPRPMPPDEHPDLLAHEATIKKMMTDMKSDEARQAYIEMMAHRWHKPEDQERIRLILTQGLALLLNQKAYVQDLFREGLERSKTARIAEQEARDARDKREAQAAAAAGGVLVSGLREPSLEEGIAEIARIRAEAARKKAARATADDKAEDGPPAIKGLLPALSVSGEVVESLSPQEAVLLGSAAAAELSDEALVADIMARGFVNGTKLDPADQALAEDIKARGLTNPKRPGVGHADGLLVASMVAAWRAQRKAAGAGDKSIPLIALNPEGDGAADGALKGTALIVAAKREVVAPGHGEHIDQESGPVIRLIAQPIGVEPVPAIHLTAQPLLLEDHRRDPVGDHVIHAIAQALQGTGEETGAGEKEAPAWQTWAEQARELRAHGVDSRIVSYLRQRHKETLAWNHRRADWERRGGSKLGRRRTADVAKDPA